MRTYKEAVKKVVDEILCDCCGESCTITEPFVDHEYATIEATWGYCSKQDGIQYNIEICENCFDEVLTLIKQKHKKILGPCNYPHKYNPLDGKAYL